MQDAKANAQQLRHFGAVCAVFMYAMLKHTRAEPDPETAANTAAADFCTLDAYHTKISDELTNWLNAATARTATLSKQAKLYSLASEIYADGPKFRAYKLLAAITTQRANEAAEDTKLRAPKLTAALTAIATKRAVLRTMQSLVGTTKHGPNTKHTADNSAANTIMRSGGHYGRCSATITIARQYSTDCSATRSKEADLDRIKDALDGLKKVKTVAAKKITHKTIKVAAEAVGTQTSTQSNWKTHATGTHCLTDAGAGSAAASEGSGAAITEMHVEGELQASEIILDGPGEKPATDLDLDVGNGRVPTLISDKVLASALREATQAKPKIINTLDSETLKTLAGTTAGKAMYEALQRGRDRPQTENPTDELIAQTLFGTAEGTVASTYLKYLSEDSHSIPGKETITGSTKELASATNYDKAMAYYTERNQRKAAATAAGGKPEEDTKADSADKPGEKKDGDNKAATTESVATEESKCDTTKCTWNKEKVSAKLKREQLLFQL
uniref:Variant surface glycoprotein 1125.3058 n=1 Tax=Trypanosoma brucei TaxID=5691 RepID=A0A1J0R9C7_9TRYP|nr:variant surface glycoprotein 1125.3058 [Trypanosoma brucei]